MEVEDFDTSALLITFVLMGKWLECRAKGSTGDAITALMALAPSSALLVTNGGERQVDAKLLLTGDVVKVPKKDVSRKKSEGN